MDVSTVLILIGIGLTAGVLSGFIGIGGGVIMVPALIIFLGMSQHEAQGVSLTLMLPPVGILAFYSYYTKGVITNSHLYFAGVMVVAFIIGGLFGARLSLKVSPSLVKLIFGVIMLYVAIKMIIGGWSFFSDKS